MQEMVIYGVSFDMVGKQPIVLLKTVTGNKFLPIWIGHAEAAAILMKLQGAETPRPMTHDLLSDVVSELNAEIAKITVTELRENTFYALDHPARGRLRDRDRLPAQRRARPRGAQQRADLRGRHASSRRAASSSSTRSRTPTRSSRSSRSSSTR